MGAEEDNSMKATLIRSEDAPRFEVHGARVTAYASPSRGSPGLCAWRVELSPGVDSPLHSLETDEVFVALRGRATFEMGGEMVPVRAGDALTVPEGTSFRIRCPAGAEPFEAIACVRAGAKARVEEGEPFLPAWAV
jgi:mannose-6-phosphate isomerase-like protein (cupin superfamily)